MEDEPADPRIGMQAYELGASRYDEHGEARPTSASMQAVEEIVVYSLLRMIPSNHVLDAATGAGRHALRLAEMGKRVVGIDTSEQMLALARAKAAKRQLDIEFRRASVLDVPVPDESFDLVICAFALAHVKNLVGAFREFLRVLRSGGHFIVTDAHPNIQKAWGPDYKAEVCDGQLLIDSVAKEAYRAGNPGAAVREVPFPQYHGQVDEYIDAVAESGAELLAAIDVPMQQGMGLMPGALVVFARK